MMKPVVLVELFLLCFCMFTQIGIGKNISRPSVVNIGALLTFDSAIGRVAKVAIQEAVNDVNADPSVLPRTRLNVTMRNSNCSGFIRMVQAFQFMETDVVAILGPQSSVAAHSISYVASELQTPLVAFSATDPTLTPRELPFFVRTTQSDAYQMTALAEMIGYYGWKQVIAIYIDDDYGRNGMSSLDDALTERGCIISYKVGIRAAPSVTRSEIIDILVKVAMLESRVIILHVYPDSGLTILSVAKYLQMMGDGYAWISTDWLSSARDSSSALSSEMMDVMQGLLVLRQHIPDSTRKKAFSARWRNLTGGTLGLNSYGLYAYDSVWLVARAIDAFLNQGGLISFSSDPKLANSKGGNLHLEAMTIFDGGKLLLENILKSDLMGLTGPLKFDSDRSLIHPAYDIINVIGAGSHHIGYWSNFSGLSTLPPEKLYTRPPKRSNENHRLYPAVWPGGTTAVPRGWVFSNNGKQLKIGVPIRVSFEEFVSKEPGSENIFMGFCIDVFIAAVNLLPYGVPYQFVGYGDGHHHPNYTDLVNMVASGNFDAAVGDISVVPGRTNVVDFTQPFIESGLVVVAPYKNLHSGPWFFVMSLTPMTWCVLMLSFVVIGVVIWILEHRKNEQFRGSSTQQLVTILWFSLSTLTFSHREDPQSGLGRTVLLIWLFVVLILTSGYSASLTSILTVQHLSSPIAGIDTLLAGKERIGFQAGSFAGRYLSKKLNISETRLFPLNSPQEYAAALQDGRIDAVVDERPYMELFLSTQCKLRIVGKDFTHSGWGFAFPRDSLLATDISNAILRLFANGDLQRIRDKWLSSDLCSLESQDNADIESSQQLHLKSFSGLFLICGTSCFLAICIFFMKLYHRFRRDSHVRRTMDSQGGSNTRQLQTIISLVDEKKEASKNNKKRRNTDGLLSTIDEGAEVGWETQK
ncbi:Glutamate receptor 3.3-like protein [Drosera capensis]